MSMVWEVGGYVSHKLKASAWGDVISRDPVIGFSYYDFFEIKGDTLTQYRCAKGLQSV